MSFDFAAAMQRGDQVQLLAVELAEQAPPAAWDDVDWSFEDEDWLRDLVESAARYARWRETGEHPYLEPMPGWDDARAIRHMRETGTLDGYRRARMPQPEVARSLIEDMGYAIASIVRWFDNGTLGGPLEPALRRRIVDALGRAVQ